MYLNEMKPLMKPPMKPSQSKQNQKFHIFAYLLRNITVLVVLIMSAGLALPPGAEALKCYQGQQNASAPVAGSPMDCPMSALSCIKSVDPSMGLVSRACQTTNCTVSFRSLQPIQLAAHRSCMMVLRVVAAAATTEGGSNGGGNFSITTGIESLVGSTSIGVAGPLLPPPSWAMPHSSLPRLCSFPTQVNGMVSPMAVCQNATAYPYQTYCCCYGDGCNGAAALLKGSYNSVVLLGSLIAAVLMAIFFSTSTTLAPHAL